ncbi:hypothetical protein [Candidatus Vampirococcus lugosii]|uniref:Uncharacterized protein n=1 Tax=Candidatus Vampirococcus lugosii TaxID=2789015 RepID=A0ABS5QL04_9BACT|nr:hypothetical protein [Candidatus Vampirococcus lugosii]MBS8121784.1 hypothetical protein [Candidatus Vampirococcus lugosii]
MKLMEVSIAIFIVSVILFYSLESLQIARLGFEDYWKEQKQYDKNINIINYSKYLVENTSESMSGYITFTGNNIDNYSIYTGDIFETNSNYFECEKKENFKLIDSDIQENIIFCEIQLGEEYFYNYSILK